MRIEGKLAAADEATLDWTMLHAALHAAQAASLTAVVAARLAAGPAGPDGLGRLLHDVRGHAEAGRFHPLPGKRQPL